MDKDLTQTTRQKNQAHFFFVFPLRWRLLVLALLVALPAFILIHYINVEQRQREALEAKTDALDLVRKVANEQSRLVDETRMLLTLAARAPALQPGNLTNCGEFLADLRRPPFPYTNVAVISPRGELLCAAYLPESPLNVADRDYFQRAMASRTFAASDYLIGRVFGRPVMGFATPIFAADGSISGVVMATLELTWLSRVVAAAALPPGSTVTVFDQKGIALARYPDAENWVGRSIPQESKLLQTILATQGEGMLEAPGLDGVSRLSAFTRLPAIPKTTPVYVSVGIPETAAYAEANRVWRRNLAWLGITTLLMAILAWLGGDLLVRRRVLALVQATRQLAAGDLGVRTGVMVPTDELGELGQTFDRMAESLQRQAAERTQSEQNLRISEERLRMLAENAQDIIFGVEFMPEPRLTYVSPAATLIAGYTPEEHYADPELGMKLVHPADRARFAAHMQAPQTLGGEIEVRWVRKDGGIIWTEQRHVPIYNSAGQITGITGVVRDVTERKHAEERLRDLEQLYRRAIAADGGVPYRRERQGAAITYTFMGERIEQLTGYSAQELTPDLWRRLTQEHEFRGALAGRSREEAAQLVRTGVVETWTDDVRILTPRW